MASTESEESRQAARECLHLARENTEPEIKASYEDLAWSYQHLADKTTVWAAWIETERVILDAAKSSLAVQKAAAGPSEQPNFASGISEAYRRTTTWTGEQSRTPQFDEPSLAPSMRIET
jgi:hypothetical protein